MELRHLRYFIAISELKSFTRAAEYLHISQPTLSHQIKQLETELGEPLLDRLPRRAELNAAGTVFKTYCMRMLKELDDGVQAIGDLKGLVRGTLRMALFHSYTSSLLGPVLAEFALRYPGVRVIARISPRSEMERDLLDGALDLAIAYGSGDTDHFVSETLFNEELVLIVSDSNPLAKRASLPMRELANVGLIMLTDEFAAREYMTHFFEREKITPHIVMEMNAVATILSTVRRSTLGTVLSEGVVENNSGLRAIRLVRPSPKRACAILWRRRGSRQAAAVRMADMIRAAYHDVHKR